MRSTGIARAARRLAAGVAAGVAATACSSGAASGPDAAATAPGLDLDASAPPGDDATYYVGVLGDEITHTFAPTYSAVYDEVLSPTCALVFCHGGSGDYLQLASKAIGYASLVDAAAEGPDCGATGLVRVEPGHPERSLLYLKITDPPCGAKMPLLYGYSGSLDPREVEQIRQWIEAGAPND